MMIWAKLIDFEKDFLKRGCLLKFPAKYPFENQVVMMVSEGFGNSSETCLVSITGHKAGINPYVIFPSSELPNGLEKRWLVKNWNHYVWEEGNIKDVLVRDPLSAEEL